MTGLPPFTVLAICLGNICRSPMMERLLVKAARDLVGDRAGDLLLVHGAGTGGWHVGESMDAAAARQVRRRGGDPGGFAARRLSRAHLEASDLVLTATAEQAEFVAEVAADAAERTFVLGELRRLLADLDVTTLPPYAPHPDAVYARGSALVKALDAARRGGRGPERGDRDDLEDPWGLGDTAFSRVADTVEDSVELLARALLS